MDLSGKVVLVFGGGKVAERKAMKFAEANAKIIVASKEFTEDLKRLRELGKANLVEADIKTTPSLVESLISKSNYVIAATDDSELNGEIAKMARKFGILACAVDNPSVSDFAMPATARIGDIQIAVSTGGKSPAMARLLRKRLEEIITPEDALQVRLQSYARKLPELSRMDKISRKDILHHIIQNQEVKRLLKEGMFEEAKIVARRIIKDR